MSLHRFSDIHTHTPGQPGTVLSIPISEVEGIVADQHYSLQLHPWHLTSAEEISAFEVCARGLADDPRFVAIGECGLDPLCHTPLALQHQAFLAALRLAKELDKPVVIHCVRLWDLLLQDIRQVFTPEECLRQPLIIHGFRKGPQLARQLLNAGLSLSLGQKYNEQTLALIPAERLYRETDAEP